MQLNKKLTGNILSLFTLKGAEYVVSFVTLPYLLRVLGPEHYGMIVFAQTIMNYGNLLVNYGFHLTAPRDIAKANPADVPRDFSSILVARMVLFLLATMLGGIGIYIFSEQLNPFLIACVFPSLLGSAIFPVWYFQGIQKMRFITIFNLIARGISVACIFALVREQTDFCLAAFLQSIVPLIAGVISLGMLLRSSRSLFVVPGRDMVLAKLRSGWDIFLSTVFINFYTNSNIFILRILTDDACVGYYAAANRLIEAVKGLLMPISSAIFPHVAVLVKESRERAVGFLCKTTRMIGGMSFLLSMGVFFFAEPIVHLIMGDSYGESIRILRIISFLPFIIGLSNIFGIQTMVAFGMQKLFSRILMASALLNFVLIFPLVCLWQATGLAVNVVIVECFVTVTMYVMLRKHGIILR